MHGVEERIAYRQADGMPYSIFSLREEKPINDSDGVGELSARSVRCLLGEMAKKSSTVLELAATINWLRDVEQVSDWKAELIRRKGTKTERGRMEDAVELLKRLDLAPP